jgi:hypothetical protein
MTQWDPIGVAGIANARDEYDSYLGLIAERLRRDSSVEEIADLLESVRTQRMGLQSDRNGDVRIAGALKVWYAGEMARARR